MVRFIKEYFKGTENYSTTRFIIEMFMLLLMTKLFTFLIYLPFSLLGIESTSLFGEMEESNTSILISDMNLLSGFLLLCVIAPLYETAINQAIPILFLSFIMNSRSIIILLTAMIFTFFHASQPLIGLFILFISGVVFSWSFIVFKKKEFL